MLLQSASLVEQSSDKVRLTSSISTTVAVGKCVYDLGQDDHGSETDDGPDQDSAQVDLQRPVETGRCAAIASLEGVTLFTKRKH